VSRCSRSDERGFLAAELVAGIALLVVPVALLVLGMPQWAERETDARAIAREVGRTLAASGWCDAATAQSLAARMATNVSLPAGDLTVVTRCAPGAILPPGSDVEVDVTVRIPPVHLPAVGDVGEWSWTVHHREPVDVYGAEP
jgi:hypothetical protein